MKKNCEEMGERKEDDQNILYKKLILKGVKT